MSIGKTTTHPMQPHAALLDTAAQVIADALPDGLHFVAMIGGVDGDDVWSSIAKGNVTTEALFEFCYSGLRHVREAAAARVSDCECGTAQEMLRIASAALQAIQLAQSKSATH